jgi:hypothetical protein
MSANQPSCRHCGALLSALDAIQGGSCRNANCRHRASVARLKGLRQTLGEPALQAARAVLDKEPAALLWLEPAIDEVVELPEARRVAHRQYLQGLVDGAPSDAVQPLASPPPETSLGGQERRLCTQCVGRCCAIGGRSHAFMSLPQLLRWQQARPDRSLQDAVEAFMQQLPAEHMRNSCVYQGVRGCVLPRADRADICNSFACEALSQVQAELRNDPEAVFVAITLQDGQVLRQAALSAATTLPLTLPPPDSGA